MTNREVDIIMKAKSGYDQAFTILFNENYNSIYYYILKSIHNEVEAEDLTMQTFEIGFQKIQKYQPLYKFKSYLLVIAKHQVVDYIYYSRRNKRDFRTHVPLEVLQFTRSNTSNPEDVMIDKQSGEIMYDAIDGLQENYKKAFGLVVIDDTPINDVSSQLGISYNLVTQHVWRAKQQLKMILAKKLIA